MKKIFITGGTGLVGRDISFVLSKKYDVYIGTTHEGRKIKNCKIVLQDITNREDLIESLEKINPNYIIHLAALTDVNLCEEKKDLATKVNIEGTKNVVLAAKKIGAKIIYASTNYVFDGEKGMYTEEDIPNPTNFYAWTKLEGEKEVLKYPNSVVTRICPFGIGRESSFTSMIIEKLSKGERMNVFSDQFFSPLSTYDYANAIMQILDIDFTGIINIAGAERVSRYEFAKKVSEIFGLDSNLLNQIKIKDLKESAKRPRDTSLDISKARKLFGDMPNVLSGLKLMKENEINLETVLN
jgi:dTDP-4-dehydrorhamnose reductase